MDGLIPGINAYKLLIMGNLILIVFGLLYWCVFLRYEMLAGVNVTSTSSIIGMSILRTAMVSLTLFVFAHHVNHLELIREKKVSIFRICFLGLLATTLPTLYHIPAALMHDSDLIFIISLLVVFLLILGRSLFIALIELCPDLGIFSSQPRTRMDMLPLDAAIVFTFFMPFMAKIFH